MGTDVAPGSKDWRATVAVYSSRRMVIVLLMGLASGLPLLLTLSTLSYWLSKVGVDKTTIGLFALVGIPYSFKFVWAPIIDHVRLPVLSAWLGRRRGWLLLLQACLAVAILIMGMTDPTLAPLTVAAAAVAVAFFSASQDIVIDAYRIEILHEEEQGAGAAATQTGYRVGLIIAGAGAIALSDFIGWPAIFTLLAAIIVVCMVVTLLAPEPAEPARAPVAAERRIDADRLALLTQWIKRAVIDPFADFMGRRGWLVILAFVLLYKFGDAIGGVMANPFYNELGFTGVEIASISKVFGVVMTVVGAIAGGALVARIGLFKALVVGGILQAVTNLLFALLAVTGKDLTMLAVAIGADNFTGGLGSAAFVAYLSSLCNRAFTGTQYALLTSFMAAGRTMLSSGGGWLADHMDWASFFVLTTFLAIPGLLLLFWLSRLYPAAPRAAVPERA
jgi:MFS transporter, PAT family, beta-lactamase induction signal transducer AmpG